MKQNGFQLKITHILNEKIDGILLSNCLLIDLFIDGLSIRNIDFFEDGFVVLSELEKSLDRSGKFLIFTDLSGIADDSGWEGVEVQHHDSNNIFWNVLRASESKNYCFSKKEYQYEIKTTLQEANSKYSGIQVEPIHIFAPESWTKNKS